MKNFKLLIVPSSDDENAFEGMTFKQAQKKASKGEHATNEFSFDTEKERETFIEGYLAGVGYLGDGLYFTKDEKPKKDEPEARNSNEIQKAKELLHNAGYITGSLWHIDDIADRYKDVNEGKPELTPEQVLEIRDSIEHGHDANIGINWEVIDIHTNLIVD